jgi:quinone-modifying oxidoreductase subunit QmoB
VVFIQSPDKDENDADFSYAGAVTSMVSLKQAKYVREDYDADGKAYLFYQHMRTPGLSETFTRAFSRTRAFSNQGQRGQCVQKRRRPDRRSPDTLLGEKLQVKADMVVLAAGMVPATKDDPVVNLAYRQGPAFRDIGLFDGYCDSNFICFPYETQRTGIYAAGAIRRAMTSEESMEDAAGAALKAIQCVESVNRGVSVHPRSGDMTFPDFFFQRCTQCKRCTEECPFGALDDDEKGTPKPNPSRCRRCGTCMGACPERIIGFADYNIDSIGSMVKSIQVPSEDDYDDPPLRILGLVCENDAYPALDIVGSEPHVLFGRRPVHPGALPGFGECHLDQGCPVPGHGRRFPAGLQAWRRLPVPFVKGSELADIRMKKIGDALASLALEEERVAQFQVAIDEYDKIPKSSMISWNSSKTWDRTPSRASNHDSLTLYPAAA